MRQFDIDRREENSGVLVKGQIKHFKKHCNNKICLLNQNIID